MIFFRDLDSKTKQWIMDNYGEKPDPTDNSDWGKIVQALENCSTSDFDLSGDYIGTDALLSQLKIGSGVSSIQYQIDDSNENTVSCTWMNLGYNGSVPEYVKYRRSVGSGYKHIWVSSLKNGELSSISENDAVYTRTYDETAKDWTYTENGNIQNTEGTFEYGNNNKYTVPLKITVNNEEYDFCGYNITMECEAIMKVLGTATGNGNNIQGDTSLNGLKFDISKSGASSGRSRWGVSDLRDWMNGSSYGSLCQRMSKNMTDGFYKNIQKTINRTWVHGDWRSQDPACSEVETTLDRFWLLGIGNINCTGKISGNELFKDQKYDTNKFNKKFTPRYDLLIVSDNRIRYKMNENGSTSESSSNWYLRSASCYYSFSPGAISYEEYPGGVYSVDANGDYCGCLPVASIG